MAQECLNGHNMLAAPLRHNEKAVRFCEEFMGSGRKRRYLFGMPARYAHQIVSQVKVNGFIDDFTQEKEFLGLPILRLEDIPHGSLILVLSTGRPLTALERVKFAGFRTLSYFEFYIYSGLQLVDILFNEFFSDKFKKNRKKFEWIYSKLGDKTSRIVFEKIINFRLSYDLFYLNGFTLDPLRQYFSSVLPLTAGEVFVDIGGYDGFTTSRFLKLCPSYKAVHFFEPMTEIMREAKGRLRTFDNINYYPFALSDSAGVKFFCIAGSTSCFSNDGNAAVDVKRLDDVLTDYVTFVKIDVEGAEPEVLKGAAETIAEFHPKIAVSVYHDPDHFWYLPEILSEIRPDYKFYLRHYTESIYETVLYCIPV